MSNGHPEHGGALHANSSRRLIIQIGLTAGVVVVAVVLVLYLLTVDGKTLNGQPVTDGTASVPPGAVRVSSSALITKLGSTEPKVVLSLYEDFLCPHCARFERVFGPTISSLIASGAAAADYHMVAILDSPRNQDYSSRAGSAAYCVADHSTQDFLRFHSALFAQQPDEFSTTFPTDEDLTETARQAGAAPGVKDCIGSGRYLAMVQAMAETTGVHATPTVRINGEDYELSTPEALAEKVTALARR
ncbi:DsbA family protein [Mycolicibacterium sp. CBM1]